MQRWMASKMATDKARKIQGKTLDHLTAGWYATPKARGVAPGCQINLPQSVGPFPTEHKAREMAALYFGKAGKVWQKRAIN